MSGIRKSTLVPYQQEPRYFYKVEPDSSFINLFFFLSDPTSKDLSNEVTALR